MMKILKKNPSGNIAFQHGYFELLSTPATSCWTLPSSTFFLYREELLNREDISVVEERENTGRTTPVISPSSHR